MVLLVLTRPTVREREASGRSLSVLTCLVEEILKVQLGILSATLVTCFAVGASAASIQLGIDGVAQVSSAAIDFGQYPNGAPYTPYPGYGTYEISLVNAGLFQSNGVTTGEFGTIQSISTTAEPAGTVLNPTPGSSSAFMTFDTGGDNLQLYLNELMPGTTSGPFTVTTTQDGTVVDFNADGFVYNTLDGQRENFTGTFSATFDGNTFDGTAQDSPFTATFALTFVPEPSSLLLMGLGAACFGLIGRRRLRT